MKASSPPGRIDNPSYGAGLLMPYLTVGLGLHVFHSAWVAILAYHAGILLILRLAGFKSPAPFKATLSPGKTLAIAALGGFAGIALAILWPHIFVWPGLTQTLERWGLTREAWPFFIAYSALVNPWLEELYWRGWLGSATRRPVVNDAFFAGFHLIILAPFVSIAWLLVSFAILSLTAWMWRTITRRARSLLPSSLFHLTADVSILLASVSEVT